MLIKSLKEEKKVEEPPSEENAPIENENPEQTSSGFGGTISSKPESPDQLDASAPTTSPAEESSDVASPEQDKEKKENETKEQSSEEKDPIDSSFENFKLLTQSSEDSYDFLKFLKAEMLELKQDDFAKLLNKIVKDKELKTKRSVIDSLLKLKTFLLLNY